MLQILHRPLQIVQAEMQCQFNIVLRPQAGRTPRVLRPKPHESLRALRQLLHRFQLDDERMCFRRRQETGDDGQLDTFPFRLRFVLAHGMDDLAPDQQTVTRLHLGGDRLRHVPALVKGPFVAPGDDARGAIVVREVRKGKEEVDLWLCAFRPQQGVWGIGGQVAVQDLRGLRAGRVERGRRREPVVAVVPVFAEAALADGVDEVVLEDALSERRAVVDEVAGALGFGAVEGGQVFMGHPRAPLH